MSDLAIENAITTRDECLAKISEAEKRISEWRARAERAERFIRDWEEFSGQKAPVSEPTQERGEPSTAKAVPKPKNPKKEEVAEAACEIILEHGSPMTRDALFEVLPSKGVNIQGQNPPVVLQTMLWRMRARIVHIKGYGYWPRDVPYEEADYDPTRPEDGDADEEARQDVPDYVRRAM